MIKEENFYNLSLNGNCFDRKLQYCQFRIQQSLSLIDDEIDRLENRLNYYKSQIFEYREKAGELQSQIDEKIIQNDGAYRMRTADLRTYISRLKTSHHQQMSELRRRYQVEIENIQREFENALLHVNSSSETRNSEQFYLISKEIEKVQSQINTYKEAIRATESERESGKKEKLTAQEEENEILYETIHFPNIFELQRAIETRSKERYECLMESRSHLNECVEKIESMIRQHSIQVQSYKDKINALDEQYENSLRQLNEKNEVKIISLKGRLDEAERRAATLAKAAHQLESENQRQIKQTSEDLQRIKNGEDCFVTSPNRIEGGSKKDFKKLDSLKMDILRLLKRLKLREEELHLKRDENGTLKREIGRLKHEIKFLNRGRK